MRKWGGQGSGDGELYLPDGIEFDSSGLLYVTDAGNYRIQVFEPDGTFVRKWGSQGSEDGQFGPARDVTLDNANKFIYVSDSGNHRVQVFALEDIPTYTLTYSAGANGSISGTTPQTVGHGGSGTYVTAVPDVGSHFVKWNDDSTENPRRDTNVQGDINVTAVFAINQYTLAYSAGANGSISGTTPQTVNHGSSGTQVIAVPNTGYHFVRWSDGFTANPRTDANVTANITVTAEFALNPPSAPSGVSATDGTYTDKVRVTWNAAGGATSYEVWRNTSNNSGSATRIASGIAGTSYDDTNVNAGVTYYYWIKAVNATGAGAFSLPASGSVFVPNLSPVISMTANPVSGYLPMAVTFGFSGSSDPDGTIVQCAVDINGNGLFDVTGEGAGVIVVNYNEPGIFKATGRVTDNSGATAVTSVTITVRGTVPISVLEARPSSGNAPLTVLLTGTNSVPASPAHPIVAYLWDVDGDGLIDRVSTTPDLEWIYRTPGKYIPRLSVMDNTGAIHSDMAEVNVLEPSIPPPEVSLSAEPERGARPLRVLFNAVATGGTGTYLWDFNGNGTYDLRTTHAQVTNIYENSGVYEPAVTFIADSGLSGSDACEVTVTEPSGLRAWITSPKNAAQVWGEAVSLMGHAAPASRVRSAQFQYKLSSTNLWINLGDRFTPPPHAYKTTWDVTVLAEGEDYDLRLIVTDREDVESISETITVRVESGAGGRVGGTEEGEVDGKHQKKSTFTGDETARVALHDGTSVEVPMDAVDGETVTVTVRVTGSNNRRMSGAAHGLASLNVNRKVSIADNPELRMPITVDIPYPDENDDGIVDGTDIRAENLTALWYCDDSGEWKRCLSVQVFTKEKFVRLRSYRLAEFGLFGVSGLPATVPAYRFYSYGAPESTHTHLWTINEVEKDVIMTWPSWQYEGVAWHALLDFTEGAAPLYRLYEPNIRRHLYTINATEYTYLETTTWNGEGAQYYVYAENTVSGLVPVYRFYHSVNQNHHFTIDANEKETIVANPGWGYTYEGIAFYVFANSTAPSFRHEARTVEVSREKAYPIAGVTCLPQADYTGDGVSDTVVYDETTGLWHILSTGGEFEIAPLAQWGGPGFIAVPGDYNGDGIFDLAVYEQDTGCWYIRTVDGEIILWGEQWGAFDMTTVSGNYDGGLNYDLAVYHEKSGQWFIRTVQGDVILWGMVWGGPGFEPVSGDHTGDGTSDLGVMERATDVLNILPVPQDLPES